MFLFIWVLGDQSNVTYFSLSLSIPLNTLAQSLMNTFLYLYTNVHWKIHFKDEGNSGSTRESNESTRNRRDCSNRTTAESEGNMALRCESIRDKENITVDQRFEIRCEMSFITRWSLRCTRTLSLSFSISVASTLHNNTLNGFQPLYLLFHFTSLEGKKENRGSGGNLSLFQITRAFEKSSFRHKLFVQVNK